VDDKTEDDYWMGDHSHTWMTLAELLAYPWKETRRKRRGVVTLDEYTRLKTENGGRPNGWCGSTDGPGIVTITSEQADAQLLAGGLAVADGTRVHVEYWWGETAAEACSDWHDEIMPALVRWADEQKLTHDDVRLVMGFDS
jgi:hypothetical protein